MLKDFPIYIWRYNWLVQKECYNDSKI